MSLVKNILQADHAQNLVFDTIPILAVWPVSVSYRYSVVGISVGITDCVFLPSCRFGGNSVFEQFGRNSYIPQI